MASQLIQVPCYAIKHKRGCHFQHPQTTYFYRSEISLLIKGIIKKEMRVSYSCVSSGYYNCRMVQSHSETRCNSKARLWKGV